MYGLESTRKFRLQKTTGPTMTFEVAHGDLIFWNRRELTNAPLFVEEKNFEIKFLKMKMKKIIHF